MATAELKGPTLRADRRRYTRTPVGLPVRVHFAGRTVPLTLEMVDASHGGCYLKGSAALPTSKVALGFTLGDDMTCLASGRVLRVDRNGFAVILNRANDSFTEFLTSLSGQVKLGAYQGANASGRVYADEDDYVSLTTSPHLVRGMG